MQLTLEHIDLAALGISDEIASADNEETPASFVAIAEAAAIIEARVPDADAVDLVVTGDFSASVLRRFGAPDDAEHFDTARGSGEAAAITIPVGDRIAIVVPAAWFIEGANAGHGEPSSAMRSHLVGHEALHVALRQRGEQTHDVRSRLARSVAHGQLVASAGVVSEEYRVQAALHAEGSNPYDNQDDLHDALVATRVAIVDGITLGYPNEPIDRSMRTVIEALHVLAIRLGYLAASRRERDGTVAAAPPPSIAADPLWHRLVGPAWPKIAAALDAFPDAGQPVTAEVLNDAVLILADTLADWIRSVGFELSDTPDQRLYFEVLRYDF
jgi:hypothetical protein